MIREAILIGTAIALSACSQGSVRGKHPLPISKRSGEEVIVGMYVEQENWQCTKEVCPKERRLYNRDFSDYVVIRDTKIGVGAINRVVEVVGKMEEAEFVVRSFRKRSAVDYNQVLSENADAYMKDEYGCVLAWNRSYGWDYDSDSSRTTLIVTLSHPSHAEGEGRGPRIRLIFDSVSGDFRGEERMNINGKLCGKRVG